MTHVAGLVLVWGAVLTYAASNSIVAILTDIGKENPIRGENPISFCNILFVGNLVALVVLLGIFGRAWTRKNLATLRWSDYVALTVSAALASAVAPGLYFYALEHTQVTNVVLVGRVEPVMILLFSTLFLHERLDRWALAGALIALAGAAPVVLQRGQEAALSPGIGEIAALGASLAFTLSTILSRSRLQHVPLGIFMIYRTALGTVFFVIAGLYIFGIDHFQHLFAPIVWQYVAIYGLVVALGGTLLWNLGLKHSRTGDISLATSFTPIAGVFFAIVIVGEPLTPVLIAGGIVVLSGILVGQFGERIVHRARARFAVPSDTEALAYEGNCNFKGL